MPHQELNPSTSETADFVVVRIDNAGIVVKLDVVPVEVPERVFWEDRDLTASGEVMRGTDDEYL